MKKIIKRIKPTKLLHKGFRVLRKARQIYSLVNGDFNQGTLIIQNMHINQEFASLKKRVTELEEAVSESSDPETTLQDVKDDLNT